MRERPPGLMQAMRFVEEKRYGPVRRIDESVKRSGGDYD